MRGYENTYPTLTPIIEAMREKFLKYWEEVPPVTILANCVHPALKKNNTILFLLRIKEFLGLPTQHVEYDVTTLWDAMFAHYNDKRNENQPRPAPRRRISSSSGLLSELRAGQDQSELQDTLYNEKRAWDVALHVPELDSDGNPVDLLDCWKKKCKCLPNSSNDGA